MARNQIEVLVIDKKWKKKAKKLLGDYRLFPIGDSKAQSGEGEGFEGKITIDPNYFN